MAASSTEGSSQFSISVLLVDDQRIIGEAVRRMLADEADIAFHFCNDPTQAINVANETQPTVILQDLVMPDVDGMTMVKFFRANPATRDTPMIVLSSKEDPQVKADAFARGANDYLVKLPDKVELIARIRYHSRAYINLLERNEAHATIARSRALLAEQMEAAEKYVRALLPAPTDKPFTLDWRYVPSADLGGDTLGYHAIDEEHFALYLVDVSGHGLDSALLSVTVMNVLRSRALANTDFRDPGQVLLGLNEAFPMDEYGDKFFTMWYGVFNTSESTLAWCGGGHPPALLFEPGSDTPIELDSSAPMIGAMPWDEFETQSRLILPDSRLYVYSDGVHEIHRTNGTEWTFEEFVAFMAKPTDESGSLLDRLFEYVVLLNGSAQLDDDFSAIEARF